MVRCLAIGDSHIPRRANQVPERIIEKLEELTKDELFDYTFFTGDLITAQNFIDFLNLKTKRDVFIVIGNMDYYGGNRNAPVFQYLEIDLINKEKLVIGLTHGHQIEPRGDHSQLEYLAHNERNFNILISGHTHQEEVFLTKNGILLLNPGSVTGAWSFIASGIPSFIVIAIDDKTMQIQNTLYQLDKKSHTFNELKSYYTFHNNSIINRI